MNQLTHTSKHHHNVSRTQHHSDVGHAKRHSGYTSLGLKVSTPNGYHGEIDMDTNDPIIKTAIASVFLAGAYFICQAARR